MDIDRKLKTALDESRLLILGTQVLFGFAFQAVFQELFKEAPDQSKIAHACCVFALVLAIGLLIAPSLVHQVAHGGESRARTIRAATGFAGLALLPLIVGLGLSLYPVLRQIVSNASAIALSLAFSAVALALLYGLGFVLQDKERRKTMVREEAATSLSTKIEQMLTEARVIIPGGQALLGFQLIVAWTRAFADMPQGLKLLHVAALCAVTLAVTLLMTPAAVHRIAYDGDDSERFFRLGSRLVVVAALPLALGIAADVAVVMYKITESTFGAVLGGSAVLAALLVLWFVVPFACRRT